MIWTIMTPDDKIECPWCKEKMEDTPEIWYGGAVACTRCGSIFGVDRNPGLFHSAREKP